MTNRYSESILIEKTALDIFYEKLGWDFNSAENTETFGKSTPLGRESMREVVLSKHLRESLIKFNPGLSPAAIEEAIKKITDDKTVLNLSESNKLKYELFKYGVKVETKNDNGINVTETVKVFDFDNPLNNHFLIARQMWIAGDISTRRPDLIGFVNGIPLLFIELKAVDVNLRNAFDKNLTDYKSTIPRLFAYNGLILLSNGLKTKIGSITGRFEHFYEWKRLSEQDEGKSSLKDTLIALCEKSRFMDVFENFILFDDSTGKTVKLIARNHQWLGVNNAIEKVKQIKESGGKLGVFWHTQGSGKSYSMLFFTEKIRRKISNKYSFLIVTDREELDKQISATYKGAGVNKYGNTRASSSKALKSLIKGNNSYVFTLIHKFNDDTVLSKRDDLIVISDEAHRTQGGTLAQNMRLALPNAAFIGFTGTPLIKKDVQKTRAIFGDYVSIYNFSRSIADGATVPLFYENRGEHLELKNPELNDQFKDAIDAADLDDQQIDKLKRMFLQEYPVFTAEKRLRSVAKDIVFHFNSRGYYGKGMVVCIDKITAVRTYNFIKEYWAVYLKETEREIKKATDEQAKLELEKKLIKLKETEICVVVSEEANEDQKFKNHNLDIAQHRLKMKSRDLERDFKDEDHPFRLVIVCSMWITGFDVPSLSTLYLDKPLTGHTLMQTIARANRVHKEKNNGLIVDYIESYKKLIEALAIYSGSSDSDTDAGAGEGSRGPIEEKAELFKLLDEIFQLIVDFFQIYQYDIFKLINCNEYERLSELEKAFNIICTNDKSKTDFRILARRFLSIYSAILPDKGLVSYADKKEVIQKLYDILENDVLTADVSHIVQELQKIVDDSILAVLDKEFKYSEGIDISGIDFKRLAQVFANQNNKNKTFQQLKAIVEDKLNYMIEQNPFREDFMKKYEEIIEEYNAGKDEVAVQNAFAELLNFVSTIKDEHVRVYEAGLSEEQMAIFDILKKDKLTKTEIDQVKSVAIKLLDNLKKTAGNIKHWRENTQTAAQMRIDISDSLYKHLPDAYINDNIDALSNAIYHHIYTRGI
ncbi:MAG: type I restriction endonuclease subunit R [Ignavibacteriaceae bacterium]|nr:type I restriction endonuclease subunit R [Ignavibacteriaceae bacterium]